MNSVVELRNWVARQLGQLPDNQDVDHVVRHIRRKTDHPCYSHDPLIVANWENFLMGVNCREILRG